MLTLIYDPVNGQATPDGLVASLVAQLIADSKTRDVEFTTGSSMVVDHLRLCVARKEITPAEVRLPFEGQLLDLSANGRFIRLPAGYCDLHGILLRALVRAQCANGEVGGNP